MSVLYPEQLLTRRAMGWAVRLKVNPTSLIIERLTGRWGSCSPEGVVRFSEDLAEMDSDFQDVVIVHELLHLRYKSHNRWFKAAMSAYVPGWHEIWDRESEPQTDTRAELKKTPRN